MWGENLLDTETFKYLQIDTGNFSLDCRDSWQHQQPKHCTDV